MSPPPTTSDTERRLVGLRSELATAMIGHFCALEQSLRLYDLQNAMVEKLLGDILLTVRQFAAATQEPMSLALSGYTVFVNQRLVRLTFADYRRAQQLREMWSALGVGEISFPLQLDLPGLKEFARHFAAALAHPRSSDLVDQPWGAVTARPALGESALGEKQDPAGDAVRVFCALVVLVRQMVAEVQAGQRPQMVHIKRALQVLVERIQDHQPLILALMDHAAARSDVAVHLVNVCVYSLLLGRQLGLSRAGLISLATAALFHDLPKAALKERTLRIIERPEGMGEVERQRVNLHWVNTLLRIVEGSGLSDETLARTVCMYESQLEFTRRDLYPGGAHAPEGHSLFSRIIATADRLDTPTWPHAGKPEAAPHQAQMALLESCGRDIAPALGRLFLDSIGFYPLGSAVLLSTGEVGVVTGQNPQGDLERPVVRLVGTAEGQPTSGPEVDLSLDHSRSVCWSMRASRLGLNSVACFR
jgi:hypothetical protein